MKRIFLVLLFVTSYILLQAQQTVSDMGLQGNVKRLYTYKHIADSIKIENDTTVSFRKLVLLEHIEYIFEKNGLLLAENRFDREKDLIEISYIYTFDEKDQLIEETRARMGQFLAGRTEYKYDKEGRKSQGLVFDYQDSLRNTVSYKYDSSGNLISEQTFNMIFIKIKDLLHHYDARGNRILSINLVTRAHSNKPYREVQKFDEQNNLIYKSYAEKDSLFWEYFAKYNAQNSLIYEELKDGKGITTLRSDLKYDKNNNKISLKQYNKDLGQETETRYKYVKGKLQSESVYSAKTKELLKTKTHFQDAQNNWIFCIEEDKKTGITIVHSRRISYF